MRQEVSKAGGMSTERFHRLVRVIQGAFNKRKEERPRGRLAHHEHGGGGCFDQRERAGITSALAGWNPSTETQGSTPFCLRSQRGLDCCSYNATPMMYVCCRTCCRSCLLDPIGSYRFPSRSGEGKNNVREKKSLLRFMGGSGPPRSSSGRFRSENNVREKKCPQPGKKRIITLLFWVLHMTHFQ